MELAKKFQNAFIKLVNEQLVAEITSVKKPNINSLIITPLDSPVYDEDGNETDEIVETTYLQEVGYTMAEKLRSDWDTYFDMCASTRMVKGEEKTEYLFARSVGTIASALAEDLAQEFATTLISAYQTYVADEAAKSEDKKRESEAKKAASKKQQAIATIAMLQNTPGIEQSVIDKIMEANGIDPDSF